MLLQCENPAKRPGAAGKRAFESARYESWNMIFKDLLDFLPESQWLRRRESGSMTQPIGVI
jgi:hypothetical protein